jgi:hypothetical protein
MSGSASLTSFQRPVPGRRRVRGYIAASKAALEDVGNYSFPTVKEIIQFALLLVKGQVHSPSFGPSEKKLHAVMRMCGKGH